MLYRALTFMAVLLLALPASYSTSADRPAAPDDLVRVEVANMALDEKERGFMLALKPTNDEALARHLLPMTIGFEEGRSIAIAYHKIDVPRPLTHDLMRRIIESYDGAVTSCVITKMENSTFFAELRLKRGGREVVIDCRPSDAIALSLRSGTPILARRAVLTQHGIDLDKPEPRDKPLKT